MNLAKFRAGESVYFCGELLGTILESRWNDHEWRYELDFDEKRDTIKDVPEEYLDKETTILQLEAENIVNLGLKKVNAKVNKISMNKTEHDKYWGIA